MTRKKGTRRKLTATRRDLKMAPPKRPEFSYASQDPFPGITEPPCEVCSWCYLNRVYQIKYVNGACRVHTAERKVSIWKR